MQQAKTPDDGIVVVTGGASGIGLALVQGLLDEGWSVLAVDLQEQQLQAAGASLKTSRAGQLHLECADITAEARVAQLVERCENDLGPITGLVNCAGIAAEKPVLETDVTTFRRILDINVIGSFIMAQAVAKPMLARARGSIVHISSVSGMRGNYGRVAYGSSKAAINNMTQVMAVEFARAGVRVNAVAPGPVDTPMTKIVHSAATRANWNRAVAMGRYGLVSEFLGPVSWLLDSSVSGYVTGQVIAVDGGFTAAGLAVPDQ